jgi:hypothetical protein
MTQDELNLVLDALKFCHGGEPCGTAEAIAVVEKALAQRTWVGLTKEEVFEICNSHYNRDSELVEMVEAKLKEKNT